VGKTRRGPEAPSPPPAPGAEPYRRALATSAEIAEALATRSDLETLTQTVTGILFRRYDCTGVGVFLLDRAGEELEYLSTAGAAGFWPFVIEGGLPLEKMGALGEALLSRRPALAQTPPSTSAASEVATWQLALPLEVESELLGALDLYWRRPNGFAATDLEPLELLAKQIATAVHNARVQAALSETNDSLDRAMRKLRRRARALRTTFRQLSQLDRAKSDFITVASHELRTPLTVLSGYSQMLLSDPEIGNDPYRGQLIRGIEGGAERLRVLIDDMLDMARIDNRALQLKPEPLFLGVLIRTLRSKLASITDQRAIAVTLDPGLDDLPLIEADTDAIRKVFHHLMVNAIKYTPDSGTVRIWGRSLTTELPAVTEPCVEIVVSDSGIGIDPEARELIFAKFYRTGEAATHSSGITKFKGGGPGLGLAIAKGIVEAHGGRIWVESLGFDEDRCPGSDFHVILPVQPEIGPELTLGKRT